MALHGAGGPQSCLLHCCSARACSSKALFLAAAALAAAASAALESPLGGCASVADGGDGGGDGGRPSEQARKQALALGGWWAGRGPSGEAWSAKEEGEDLAAAALDPGRD